MNTAELARKLPTQARYDLLSIWADPAAHRRISSPLLTQKGLVNVVDGQATLSERGVQVVRHLDAGHQVQMRGRMAEIFRRVLAAQAVDSVATDIEQEFARFTTSELDQFAAALDHVRAALRKSMS
jgi:hypothetical protein